MKFKAKHVIIITVILMLSLLLLITFSHATEGLAVSDIEVTLIGTKAEIKWNKTNEAIGYEIYIDIPNIGYLNLGSVSTNNVNVTGFKEGEIYGVKVIAYKIENNTKIYSDFSPEVRFKIGENLQTTSKLGKVTNVKAVSYGDNGTLEWNPVEAASGYDVYASVANIDFIKIGTTDATKVKITGMNKNEVYSIKIIPFIENNGKKTYGSFSDLAILKYDEEEKVQIDRDKKVENLNVIMNGDSAKLTWNSMNGADGYEIAVKIPNKGEAFYNVSSNIKTLTGFSANYTYKARVRAYQYVNGEKVYSNYSNYVSIKYEKLEKLTKVTGLNVKMSGDKATFSWNKVIGAVGYEIIVNIPGIGDCTYTETSTSKELIGFTEKNYYYTVKVRAYKYGNNGEKIYGEYSNKAYFRNEEKEEVIEKPAKVTGLNVKMSGDKATFSWNKVIGAAGYEIIVNIPGIGDCTYTETSTSKELIGFTEKNYYYTVKVRAYKYGNNGEKIYGEYSNKAYFRNEEKEEVIEKPAKVIGLNVNRNNLSATFSWNKVTGASGYEIVVNIPLYGEFKYTETSTTRYMTGFTEKNYYYTVKVRAYKYGNNGQKIYGEYSDIVKF